MATTRPFALNVTQTELDGCAQVGDLAISNDQYVNDLPPAGERWWMGPNEDLGYVIAHAVDSNTQKTQIPGVFGSVGFTRTSGTDSFSDQKFISLAQKAISKFGTGGPGPSLDTARIASNELFTNGLWSSYDIINASLVLKLKAEDYFSYPGAGSTWYDVSGLGNNGSITGATNDGLSFQFDGTGNYVSVGQIIPSNSSFSISAWVNAADTTGSRNIVSSENSPFWISNGTLQAGVAGNYNIVSSDSFPTGTWKFVTVTFDTSANEMNLYINASQIQKATGVTSEYTSEPIYIGSHFSGGSPVSFWNGDIAQVYIHTNAQPADYITNIFNATRSLYGV